MTNRTAVFESVGPTDSAPQDLGSNTPGFLPILVLSAWCGLVAGLLEVGTIIWHKYASKLSCFYWMSRHFVWLIPSLNLVIFLILGMGLSVLVWYSRRRGYWLATRLLMAHDLAPTRLGRLSPDLQSCRISPDAGYRGAIRPGARAPCHRVSTAGPGQLSRGRRSGADPGSVGLGIRQDQGMARGDAAAAATGLPERSLDRAGHGGRGPSEPLRLRSTHQPDDR